MVLVVLILFFSIFIRVCFEELEHLGYNDKTMKKIRVYLDTSVIGGCFDEEFKEHSILLMDEIISRGKLGVISATTVKELSKAPKQVTDYFEKIYHYLEELKPSDEINELANTYLLENIVTEKYYEDLLHIATATINQVDVLVSWNFKHIVHYKKIPLYNAVNTLKGYKTIQIYSPREVINYEE